MSITKRVGVFLSLFLGISIQSIAQQNELGNWLMYFGQNKLSNKFSLQTEAQYRNYTIEPNIEQLLLRTGINYHFQSTAFATIGYGYIGSYDFETEQNNPETEEHRIWQQLITTNQLGSVKLEHRYRVEQRFIGDDYKNRLRYRLMLFVPINKPTITEGSIFLGIYDEIFLNTERTFFDRNRLYGAVGYQLDKATSFQAGILHQQVNEFGKWYLQFAIFYNPDFRKKKSSATE